ncbi:MAG: choice-of-anchor D domain-containing protein [Janthinobacterium lividum]
MHRSSKGFLFLSLLLGTLPLRAQQVGLLGLRALNGAGALHGLRHDTAGNLYTLFDAADGVRLLKLNPDGTQLLAQTQLGQAGDAGLALDLDPAGNIYVAGTSNSLGSVTGTQGTAFPNRAGTRTNSFVAKFSPQLQEQWLTFCGAEPLAVSSIAANANTVYVTGSIFTGTLPVTSNGIQQSPAPNSSSNGFVESFSTASASLQYATYLTGANGDTAPAEIVADSGGNTYIAGLTTATGYPTTAALVPVFRSTGGFASGFLTELTPGGDGFLFSTFVPGNGLTSVALDTGGSGSLLVSGDIAPGLFPLSVVQVPVSSQLRYQTAVRLALDGSAVQSSTLLAPATQSVITAGPNGAAWIAASLQNSFTVPLLPVTPVETLGNAFALRLNSAGRVDRAVRFGGLPVTNSGYASLPAVEGGVSVQPDGTVAVAGSVTPTVSADLLPAQTFDLSFVGAPAPSLPSTVRDAQPSAACASSACSGGAGLLLTLNPDSSAPTLALSFDDLPNLILRNLGTATADNVTITANGYGVNSGCGSTLLPGAECALLLTGSGPGTLVVQAANAATFSTSLPASIRAAKAVTVLPRELDFGIVASASSATTRTLTVSNLGTTTQTFSSQNASTVGSTYTLYEAASTCTPSGSGKTKMLAPGGTCTVTLALQANTTAANDGGVNAHWQIGTTDVQITGYAQAATLSLSAGTVDFGRQFTGGLRSSRYLYLFNSSDRVAAHTAVTNQSAAFSVADQCPATLQPHSVCRMALAYEAAASPSSDATTLNVDGLQATVLGETLPQPTIAGTSSNPNLRVSPTSIAFTNAVIVTQGSSESHDVTISNAGGVPFALALAAEGDFSFNTGCPATLNGGASCTVTLSFTPTSSGNRQGLLSVTAGSSAPAYVSLSGMGTAIVAADGVSLGFGEVPLSTPVVQWLKVSQSFPSLTVASSDANFSVLLVEDNGYGHGQPAASRFSSNATGSCLNCYLGVQFLPHTTGPQTASIMLISQSSGKPAKLQATGIGIPLTGVILTPVSQDFGTVAVHSSSATVLFQLTNGTSANLSTTGVSVSGDFAATGETTGAAACTSGALAPGASCLVPVRFTPSVTGGRSGTLTVTTSAGAVSSPMNGTGSDDPGIAFTPGEVRFDNVPGIAAQQQNVTVTNTSTTPATVGTSSVSDTRFATTSGCGTLAPGAACTVTVSYTPGSSLASGTLLIPVTTTPAGAPAATQYALALSGLFTSDTAGLQIVPGEHSTMNFGVSPTGVPGLSRVLHVNNLSRQTLAVAVEMPRQFSLNGSTCTTLLPGAGCDLTVEYTPLTSSDTTGTVFVTGTPADGSATQSGLGYLQGYGLGATAGLAITGDISPTNILSFGQINSGERSSKTLTVTNPVSSAAGTAITVRRILSEAPFLSTSTCGAPLLPGQSCAITLTYAPVFQVTPGSSQTSTESDTGTLLIESDGANAPQIIDLAGAAKPAFVASPNNAPLIAAYTTSQGSLTFTAIAVGTPSDPQTVTLTNTGMATLHVQGLIPSNGFSASDSGSCAALAPAATCDIAVRYAPQTAAVTLGSLAIQSDSSDSLEFVSLLGTLGAAQTPSAQSVSLSPQALDFGRVLVRGTASRQATLTNTGAAPVVLGTPTVSGDSGFAIAASNTTNACPAGSALAAGASCTIAVTFTPGTTGTLRGTLFVSSSATAQPLTVALSGVGTQPLLSVSPVSISFGDVVVGSSTTQAVTLINGSAQPVDGLQFTASTGFRVSTSCGITTINAGSSCAVNVTFAPGAPGIANGVLTVTSTDPASPITVPLSGNGVQATAVSATSLSAAPSALNFGNVTVGGSSQLALTLSNPTASPVSSLLFTASTGFTVSSSCGTTLNAYSTCPVLVTFSPTSTGAASGTVQVQNAGSNTPLTIALSGTGTSTQSQLIGTPGALNFGNVAVGGSSTLSVTITNTSATTINSIAAAINPSSFTVASDCGSNMNSNASCNLLVTYTPTAAGASTGMVTLQSSDATSPLRIALTGTGTVLPPQLSLTPASLNFGVLAVGNSATLTTTLLNTGNASVSSIAIGVTAGFTANSTCGSSLAPGSSCSIAVTYAATAAGVLSGLLTVNSSDPASPLTASLTAAANIPGSAGGGGFLLSVNGSTSASATVQAGLPASFALLVTPVGGYTGSVALTCSADTPVAYAACSLVPPSVTLAGTAQGSTVTISTVAAVALASLWLPGETAVLWCSTPVLFFLLFRRKRPAALLITLTGLVTLGGLGGCGSGGDPRIRYVAPGTYSFHVTATSTSGTTISQTVALSLTVTKR